MEMQQILEMLAEMNGKREKRKAEMKAWQAESDAYYAKLDGEREKRKADMKAFKK
jgi:hypothetical protein